MVTVSMTDHSFRYAGSSNCVRRDQRLVVVGIGWCRQISVYVIEDQHFHIALRLHFLPRTDPILPAVRGCEFDDLRAYIETHFRDLCAAVSGGDFVRNMRNKPFHKFAPNPPYALRQNSPDAPYVVEVDGWKQFNLDRLSRDVLAHLDARGDT